MAPCRFRFISIRGLLLMLLALGLVTRLGSACEAMTAAPTATAHCADMPKVPAKPLKVLAAPCALCAALPDLAADVSPRLMSGRQAPAFVTLAGLAGPPRGPIPPPPRQA